MKKRSECDCMCHKPGQVMTHLIPCCVPDEMHQIKKENNFRKALKESFIKDGISEETANKVLDYYGIF